MKAQVLQQKPKDTEDAMRLAEIYDHSVFNPSKKHGAGSRSKYSGHVEFRVCRCLLAMEYPSAPVTSSSRDANTNDCQCSFSSQFLGLSPRTGLGQVPSLGAEEELAFVHQLLLQLWSHLWMPLITNHVHFHGVSSRGSSGCESPFVSKQNLTAYLFLFSLSLTLEVKDASSPMKLQQGYTQLEEGVGIFC